jgi:hypothetical protein
MTVVLNRHDYSSLRFFEAISARILLIRKTTRICIEYYFVSMDYNILILCVILIYGRKDQILLTSIQYFLSSITSALYLFAHW